MGEPRTTNAIPPNTVGKEFLMEPTQIDLSDVEFVEKTIRELHSRVEELEEGEAGLEGYIEHLVERRDRLIGILGQTGLTAQRSWFQALRHPRLPQIRVLVEEALSLED